MWFVLAIAAFFLLSVVQGQMMKAPEIDHQRLNLKAMQIGLPSAGRETAAERGDLLLCVDLRTHGHG
jgi:hypothetical protein